MDRKKAYLILLFLVCTYITVQAQMLRIAGWVYDADTGQPVEFASVLLSESGQWAITDSKGLFQIKNVPQGTSTFTVQCLGYKKRTFPIELYRNIDNMQLRLKPENLKLDGVTVVAKRKQGESTTSYTIERQTLDQQQILNISDIATLLPGGKTVNPSLINDSRLALRSSAQEKGNASFGTAIEIDGMRMDNNAAAGETMAASTRTVSASNVESVEIVTGIPSVEYGDLSNGVVRISTRKGKSPFIIEGKLNQHTKMIAVHKGFDLNSHTNNAHTAGVLNVSFERTRSFSDAASPYTAYQHNVLSLHYMNTFMQTSPMPLTLNVGLTGNVGGYNSKYDPDRNMEEYAKTRDNALRAHFEAQWLLNKPWITNLWLRGAISFSDRKSEDYRNENSAATKSYIHTTEEGYFMAEDYAKATAGGNSNPAVILSPTGYWYVRSYHDSKPLSWQLKLKGEWTRRFGRVASKLMTGIDYSGSRNNGRGTYYEDLRYTPTWREYRYDEMPTMHNAAAYIEEKIILPAARRSTFELTAGLRNDVTMISNSDYGTVASLSPRANARYVFWRGQRKRIVSDLEIHAGWGKSVKLPSFQVLYPSPTYYDKEVFASTSDANNTSYRAFYTQPSKAVHNPQLRWQYTQQTDIGIEMTVKGTRIAVSAFHHKTFRPYMSTMVFTPLAYLYTAPDSILGAVKALSNMGIDLPVADRQFSIDRQSGQVTMSDASGAVPATPVGNTVRKTYTQNTTYVNATPLNRYGLEWMIDFAQIRPLRTSIRIDGNYYYYKGTDEVLFADMHNGSTMTADNKQPYQYIGYYRGSSVSGTGYSANASVANGSLSRQLSLNATLTTHIPKIRMIVALRLESTLYSSRRLLCELSNGIRGYTLENANDQTGLPYDGKTTDKYIVVYPEYYSTWENPTELIPFAERYLWAKDHDATLYNDLSALVVRSNYAYTMNPDRLSAFYSANLSVTKEIGNHVSVSFYANNFFNNMGSIRSSQTGLETSLFGSSYIPDYYYGLSLRLKL